MPERSLIIAGVGRSGTKLLQILGAYIVADQGGPVTLNYEPLLWSDHTVQRTNPDAIRVHQDLPLLTPSGFTPTREQQAFFEGLASNERGGHVTKFIRMTGRLTLLRDLFPSEPLVFVYRSAAGVVNSMLNTEFSLLGPPHYESDWERLIDEAEALELIDRRHVGAIENERWALETVHWYVMNKKAASDLASMDALILSYESMIADPEKTTRSLCRHLGAEYREAYLKLHDIPGSRMRNIDQLLRLDDKVERRFAGVFPIDEAPILGMKRTAPRRTERLTENEVQDVEAFCADATASLEGLRTR